MTSRARFQVNDVLHQLDSDDEWVAEGSDDDLGMASDYSYDSDSSGEGTQSLYSRIVMITSIKSN